MAAELVGDFRRELAWRKAGHSLEFARKVGLVMIVFVQVVYQLDIPFPLCPLARKSLEAENPREHLRRHADVPSKEFLQVSLGVSGTSLEAGNGQQAVFHFKRADATGHQAILDPCLREAAYELILPESQFCHKCYQLAEGYADMPPPSAAERFGREQAVGRLRHRNPEQGMRAARMELDADESGHAGRHG